MIPEPENVGPPDPPGENPYFHICVVVFRLVAAGFMVVGVLNLAAYWFKCRHDAVPMSAGHCAYLSIALVIGVVLLVISPALARRVAVYLDDMG